MASAPATPYLRVDLARLRRNIDRVAERARERGRGAASARQDPQDAWRSRGSSWRPGAVGHHRGHAGRGRDVRAPGLHRRVRRLPALARRRRGRRGCATSRRTRRVAIGVDSVEGAGHSGRCWRGPAVEVLVEVDSGHHRTGVAARARPARSRWPPARRARGARRVHVPGAQLRPGRHPDGAAGDEAARPGHGGAARCARAGSSRGWSAAARRRAWRPARHRRAHRAAAGRLRLRRRPAVGARRTTTPESIALTCRATVVSHAGGRLVLDAGSKALGADRAAYATGFGRLLDHPTPAIVLLSEHHAVVDLAGAPLPRSAAGSTSCPTTSAPRSTSSTSCASRSPADCGLAGRRPRAERLSRAPYDRRHAQATPRLLAALAGRSPPALAGCGPTTRPRDAPPTPPATRRLHARRRTGAGLHLRRGRSAGREAGRPARRTGPR